MSKKKIPTAEDRHRQKAEIERAILLMVQEWAHLENAFSLLLESCIRGRSGIGFRLYYSISNTETRIKMVDTAVIATLENDANWDRIMPLWQKILTRVNRYKDTRNSVIHGQITNESLDDNRSYMRLTPPTLDHVRRAAMRRPRQLPGMGAADITASALAISNAAEDLRLMLVITGGYYGEYRTPLQALPALEARLRIDDRPGGPIPEES